MNCNTAQRLLSAYVDSELSMSEMDRVRKHVQDCDCCRYEEEDLRRLKSILTSTPIVEPPVDFERALLVAGAVRIGKTRLIDNIRIPR